MSPSTKITSLAALMLAFSSVDGLSLKRTYAGSSFFDGFNFKPSTELPNGDPTGGFVNYLPRKEAESRGLAKVQGNQVRIAADSSTTYSTSDQGRASIRLESHDSFDTGLLIADIAHMPGYACGVWPAFWTFNFNENPYGEVDIIEGAMFQDGNSMTLWTDQQCKFTNIGTKEQKNDCNLDRGGCGGMGPRNSYGSPFNDVGGGVYATYIQSQRLRIWFWPKAQVPADARSNNPNPDSWGTPLSDFQTKNGGCDVGKTFHSQSIIINTDFCGSEVSQEWWDNSPDCVKKAPNCREYVAKNPKAFTEAYWLINSIKLFQ
ncbi:hypothetical protein PG990_002099 [Apiospora arundinis]